MWVCQRTLFVPWFVLDLYHFPKACKVQKCNLKYRIWLNVARVTRGKPAGKPTATRSTLLKGMGLLWVKKVGPLPTPIDTHTLYPRGFPYPCHSLAIGLILGWAQENRLG
jgi:hypothetical protein